MWTLVRHYNFSPEFVNELPPAERSLYISMGEKEGEEIEGAMSSSQTIGAQFPAP